MSAPHPYRTKNLAQQMAVVVGASGGIGRAITMALARERVRLCLLGRKPDVLAKTVAAARRFTQVKSFQVDLTVQDNLIPVLGYLNSRVGGVDILIHCADVLREERMETASIDDLDLQYATNIRAPYLLTQRLLPLLIVARGQLVFINSSVAQIARRPEIGQYAATKHALKAIADSLREEVNQKGVRVISLFLGRTATSRQEALHRKEGKTYNPETLLQPEDVAFMVVQALKVADTAEVTDLSIRPRLKAQV